MVIACVAAAGFRRTAEMTMSDCLSEHVASYAMMCLVHLLARFQVIA